VTEQSYKKGWGDVPIHLTNGNRAALFCQSISYLYRGQWPLTNAGRQLPDTSPVFTAWACSPLLFFVIRQTSVKEKAPISQGF